MSWKRHAALETALQAVWRTPAAGTVDVYLRALRACVRHERNSGAAPPLEENDSGFTVGDVVGDYVLEWCFGSGTDGDCWAAHHRDTGAAATLKWGAGSEPLVYEWLGRRLPPEFLQVFSWNWCRNSGGTGEILNAPHYSYVEAPTWIARERAVETWKDYRARLAPECPSLAEALGVFATACRGVAALHALGVYGWSAHERNLFRVGDVWKLGDLGRNCIASAADDPRLIRLYAMEMLTPSERCSYLEELGRTRGPWHAFHSWGVFPSDAHQEHRLRQDDCAMLAGLLCDLLGVNRWEVFYQAIRRRPLCSRHYALTGPTSVVDEQLSVVLNKAWLGDSGGALAVAAGLPWDSGYDAALELLADVAAALRRLSRDDVDFLHVDSIAQPRPKRA